MYKCTCAKIKLKLFIIRLAAFLAYREFEKIFQICSQNYPKSKNKIA